MENVFRATIQIFGIMIVKNAKDAPKHTSLKNKEENVFVLTTLLLILGLNVFNVSSQVTGMPIKEDASNVQMNKSMIESKVTAHLAHKMLLFSKTMNVMHVQNIHITISLEWYVLFAHHNKSITTKQRNVNALHTSHSDKMIFVSLVMLQTSGIKSA